MLVKYFAAGLRNRERCFWVTAEPINCARAIRLRVRADKQVLGIRRRSLVVVHTSRELQALVVR